MSLRSSLDEAPLYDEIDVDFVMDVNIVARAAQLGDAHERKHLFVAMTIQERIAVVWPFASATPAAGDRVHCRRMMLVLDGLTGGRVLHVLDGALLDAAEADGGGCDVGSVADWLPPPSVAADKTRSRELRPQDKCPVHWPLHVLDVLALSPAACRGRVAVRGYCIDARALKWAADGPRAFLMRLVDDRNLGRSGAVAVHVAGWDRKALELHGSVGVGENYHVFGCWLMPSGETSVQLTLDEASFVAHNGTVEAQQIRRMPFAFPTGTVVSVRGHLAWWKQQRDGAWILALGSGACLVTCKRSGLRLNPEAWSAGDAIFVQHAVVFRDRKEEAAPLLVMQDCSTCEGPWGTMACACST